jgi:hypothetical protein
MDKDQYKTMVSVHSWLKKQKHATIQDCKKNPTVDNLQRLKEIKARYLVEIRNLQNVIDTLQ